MCFIKNVFNSTTLIKLNKNNLFILDRNVDKKRIHGFKTSFKFIYWILSSATEFLGLVQFNTNIASSESELHKSESGNKY